MLTLGVSTTSITSFVTDMFLRIYVSFANFLAEHLPVFINIDCSECKTIENLILSPLHGVALIKTHTGQVYSKPCHPFDMLRLRKCDSVGNWINDYCFG